MIAVFAIACWQVIWYQSISVALISFTIITVMSLVLFSIGFWAGGDAKLVMAISPLLLPSQLMDWLVMIALFGGVLSLFYLIKYRVIYKQKENPHLPYGVAIVAGTTVMLYSQSPQLLMWPFI
ncbi:hypothetical protein L0B53_01755 [Vibrio sp. SS-MA-C1-2]|nr:hypothetical protein L0B53_01755 [Vibrio sp. SS-MA-C1-2]